MARDKTIRTPKGVFKYAYLNDPDRKGAERFGGDLEYRVTLLMDKDDPEVQEFLKVLDKRFASAMEAAEEKMDEANVKTKAAWKKKKVTEPTANPPYADELDENGEPTGMVEIKAKTKYKFLDKDSGKMKVRTIPFVDGKGQVIPAKKRPRVFSGTIGRLAVNTVPVFIAKDADCYLGLYLSKVQLIKLSEGGGDDNVFGEEEESDVFADDLDEVEEDDTSDDLDDDLEDDGDDTSSSDDDDDDNDDLDDEIPF